MLPATAIIRRADVLHVGKGEINGSLPLHPCIQIAWSMNSAFCSHGQEEAKKMGLQHSVAYIVLLTSVYFDTNAWKQKREPDNFLAL